MGLDHGFIFFEPDSGSNLPILGRRSYFNIASCGRVPENAPGCKTMFATVAL